MVTFTLKQLKSARYMIVAIDEERQARFLADRGELEDKMYYKSLEALDESIDQLTSLERLAGSDLTITLTEAQTECLTYYINNYK